MTADLPDTVWTRAGQGRRGPARSLDLGQLAAAGVEIADRTGLEAVTMRAVAAEVGASSAGLYRYVETRDELIDLMVDRVTQELALPKRRTPWRTQLIKLAVAQRDAYQRHPWLVDASRGPRSLGPNGGRLVETYLWILEPVEATTAAKLELFALLTGTAALFAPPASVPANPFPLADATSTPLLWAALTTPTGKPRSPDILFAAVVNGAIDAVLG